MSDSYAPLQQEHEGEIAGQVQQPPVHQAAHPPAGNPYLQPQQMQQQQQQPGQQLPPQQAYYPAGPHPALAQPFQGVARNGAGQPVYPQIAPQYQQPPPMMVDAYGRPVAYMQQPGMPPMAPQYVMAAPMGGIQQQQPVGNPGQPGHLPRGRFSDGIFDCFDGMSICLISWCLLPIRFAQTMERVRWMTFGSALAMYGIPWLLFIVFETIFELDPSRWWWAIPAALCNLTCVVLGCTNRGKLRAHYQIPGSEAEDCLLHLCCRCCAVAQEARHVDRDYAIPI